MSLLLELYRSRQLLLSLVKRDLKVRYKDSILGFFWSFCRPLFLMLILSAVFSLILGAGYGVERNRLVPYPLFLLTGILPWMYFAGSLSEGTSAMLLNASLIKKVSINAAVFPAAVVASNLIHLILAFVVYLAFLFYYGVGLSLDLWILVPALLVQTFFILAVALLCSVLNVFYRDVVSITEVLLTAWFYVSPVFYPFDFAAGEMQRRYPAYAELMRALYLANPMAPVLMAYRRAFVFTGEEPLRELSDAHLAAGLGLAALLSGLLYLLAVSVYRRFGPRLADEM